MQTFKNISDLCEYLNDEELPFEVKKDYLENLEGVNFVYGFDIRFGLDRVCLIQVDGNDVNYIYEEEFHGEVTYFPLGVDTKDLDEAYEAFLKDSNYNDYMEEYANNTADAFDEFLDNEWFTQSSIGYAALKFAEAKMGRTYWKRPF